MTGAGWSGVSEHCATGNKKACSSLATNTPAKWSTDARPAGPYENAQRERDPLWPSIKQLCPAIVAWRGKESVLSETITAAPSYLAQVGSRWGKMIAVTTCFLKVDKAWQKQHELIANCRARPAEQRNGSDLRIGCERHAVCRLQKPLPPLCSGLRAWTSDREATP
jgi:hypothetical protein